MRLDVTFTGQVQCNWMGYWQETFTTPVRNDQCHRGGKPKLSLKITSKWVGFGNNWQTRWIIEEKLLNDFDIYISLKTETSSRRHCISSDVVTFLGKRTVACFLVNNCEVWCCYMCKIATSKTAGVVEQSATSEAKRMCHCMRAKRIKKRIQPPSPADKAIC